MHGVTQLNSELLFRMLSPCLQQLITVYSKQNSLTPIVSPKFGIPKPTADRFLTRSQSVTNGPLLAVPGKTRSNVVRWY